MVARGMFTGVAGEPFGVRKSAWLTTMPNPVFMHAGLDP